MIPLINFCSLKFVIVASSSICLNHEVFENSGPGFQDLDIWLSGPGFQNLNARFQDLDLRTRVSGPQCEISGPGSQDLGFRPSVFGSQDQGFRTSKALHPTLVLSFSRHFSLRPVVTDGQTHGLSEFSPCVCPSVGTRDLWSL